jgi:hypothetical protein
MDGARKVIRRAEVGSARAPESDGATNVAVIADAGSDSVMSGATSVATVAAVGNGTSADSAHAPVDAWSVEVGTSAPGTSRTTA